MKEVLGHDATIPKLGFGVQGSGCLAPTLCAQPPPCLMTDGPDRSFKAEHHFYAHLS